MFENLGFHPKYLQTWKLLRGGGGRKVSIRKCCYDTLWGLFASGIHLCEWLSTLPADWLQLLRTPQSLRAFPLLNEGCCSALWQTSLRCILGAGVSLGSLNLWAEWGSQITIPARHHSSISELNCCWFQPKAFCFVDFQLFNEKLKNLAESTNCDKKIVNEQSSIETNVWWECFLLTSSNKRAVNTSLEHCR